MKTPMKYEGFISPLRFFSMSRHRACSLLVYSAFFCRLHICGCEFRVQDLSSRVTVQCKGFKGEGEGYIFYCVDGILVNGVNSVTK